MMTMPIRFDSMIRRFLRMPNANDASFLVPVTCPARRRFQDKFWSASFVQLITVNLINQCAAEQKARRGRTTSTATSNDGRHGVRVYSYMYVLVCVALDTVKSNHLFIGTDLRSDCL